MISSDVEAPGHIPGADGLPWYRRAMAQGLGYFLPSSAFMAVPLYFSFGELPLERYIWLVIVELVIAGFFLGSTLIPHWSHERRWLWVAGLLGAVAVLAWVCDDLAQLAYFTPYATSVAAGLLPWRESRSFSILVGVFGVGIGAVVSSPFAVVIAVMAGVLGLSIGLEMAHERTKALLAREELRTAALAVAAERERIGRDLHDILGHSLTTIAVKADLAGRLISRDPAMAQVEISDLAKVARQALADVRATASGMREVRLAGEVAAARSVLLAAGVECRAPNALPVLDDATSELFGYVVREAVTNVVRHSGASTCTLVADQASVTISDNGRGLRAETKRTGLAGLAARLEAVGGRLEVASTPSGTTVRAALGELGAME